MSAHDLRDLPPTLGLQKAGELLGFSRQHTYDLAREGEFPVPVHRVRGRYRVPTAPLLRYLGVESDHRCDTDRAASNGQATFSPAIRRELDFSPAVYVTTKSGKRIRIDPDKTYTYKGRKGVSGAEIIAERQA